MLGTCKYFQHSRQELLERINFQVKMKCILITDQLNFIDLKRKKKVIINKNIKRKLIQYEMVRNKFNFQLLFQLFDAMNEDKEK